MGLVALMGVSSVNAEEIPQPEGTQININTATKEELQQITGIGPKYADRILEYRRVYQTFDSIDEIVNVKGIGPKTFERIKSQIRV